MKNNFQLSLFIICLILSAIIINSISVSNEKFNTFTLKKDDKKKDTKKDDDKEEEESKHVSIPTLINRGFKCATYKPKVDLEPMLCANAEQECSSRGVMLMGKMNNGEFVGIVTKEPTDCTLENFGVKTGETIVGKKCYTHTQEEFPDITPDGEAIDPEVFSHRVCQKGGNMVGKILKQGKTAKCDKATFGEEGGSCRCYKTKIPGDDKLVQFYYPIRYSEGEFQCIADLKNNLCKYYKKDEDCKKEINEKGIKPAEIKRTDKSLTNMVFGHFFNRWICPKESGLKAAFRYNTENMGKTYNIECLGRNGDDCFQDKNADIACDRVNSCPEGEREFQSLGCASPKFKQVWFHDGFNVHTPNWCKEVNAYIRYDGSIQKIGGTKKIALVYRENGMSSCIQDPQVVLPKCLEENALNILEKTIKFFEKDLKQYKNLVDCKGELLLEASANENHWCSKSLILPDNNGKFDLSMRYKLDVKVDNVRENTKKENKFNQSQVWRKNFLKVTKRWIGKEHMRLMADVNGDDLKDIVGFYDDGVYVSINNSGNSFSEPTMWSKYFGKKSEDSFTVKNSHRLVVDINDDGKADIVGINEYGTFVSISNGEKFLEPKKWTEKATTKSIKPGYETVFLADMTKDGKKDLVVFDGGAVFVGKNTGEAFEYESKGDGIKVDEKNDTIFVQDIDNDGFADFIIIDKKGSRYYINDKKSNFSGKDKKELPAKTDKGDRLFFTDISKNKLPDLVVVSSKSVEVYRNKGSGKFDEKPSTLTKNLGKKLKINSKNLVNPVFLADVNNDKYPDLVIFSEDSVSVCLSDGGKKFEDANEWVKSEFTIDNGYNDNINNPRFVEDVNGNGMADIIGFSESGVEIGYNQDSKFSTAKLVVDGFNAGVSIKSFNKTKNQVFFIDMNKDGKTDVVTFGDKQVFVALSKGSALGAPEIWLRNPIKNVSWTKNTLVKVVDLNNDGYPDIIAFNTKGVVIAFNDEGKSFNDAFKDEKSSKLTSKFKYKRGQDQAEIVDVNNDDLPDIVFFGKTTQVALNRKGESFYEPKTWSNEFGKGWPTNDSYRWVIDVNNDGYADIVAIDAKDVRIAINDEGKKFKTSVVQFEKDKKFTKSGGGWSTKSDPRFMVDMNNDKLPDLVGFKDGKVQISFNEAGSLTDAKDFSTKDMFGTKSGFKSVEAHPRYVLDVNKDGYADVVGFNDQGVFVALNKEGKELDDVEKWTSEFAKLGKNDIREVHDMNGNGYPDLIVMQYPDIFVAKNDLA